MSVELFYLGITHRTAPLAVREALSPNVEKQRAMLGRLSSVAVGRMVVSTCERFELYLNTEERGQEAWTTRVAHWFQLPVELLTHHARTIEGPQVAHHLLRVSAGLESRVLGEPQILGQVRDAYLRATECAALDPVLSALGRAAIRAGKRVRHETPINRGDRSIPTLAVKRILQAVCKRPASLVVLGSGRLARDVAATWTRDGNGPLTVVARNASLAREMAKPLNAIGAGIETLDDAIATTDAVVACTAAPCFLVGPELIAAARTRALCLVDLSVPRNIDPTVAQLPCAVLCHLDDLLLAESRPARIAIEAERIVEEECVRFEQWRQQRRSVAAITSLVRDTFSRALADPRSTKRELHRRIVRLKSHHPLEARA